jgi:hypothetical protein
MRRSLALIPIAVLAAGCGTAATAAPAPPPPAFDTISSIDVGGDTGSAVITYNVDSGSNLDDNATRWQVAQHAPFHTEVSKPHGPRDVGVKAFRFGQGAGLTCTLRINGVVVAADQAPEAGTGARCSYVGTPG